MSEFATIVRVGATLVFAAGAVAAGCDRKSEPSTATPPSRVSQVAPAVSAAMGGPTTAIEPALNNLAEARCDRETRCNNVGTGRRFDSRAACINDVRSNHADDVNRSECPAGVDARELAECMEEVRNEDCNSPLDTLGRIAACRSSDLCRHI